MNDHIHPTLRPAINTLLHRPWPVEREIDPFERQEAMRERDYERRRAAHPDPHDPDHPDELEFA